MDLKLIVKGSSSMLQDVVRDNVIRCGEGDAQYLKINPAFHVCLDLNAVNL